MQYRLQIVVKIVDKYSSELYIFLISNLVTMPYCSATWGIWNVDMKAYDESIVDWVQNKWSIANGWLRTRNNVHSQKSTEEMVRSYPQAWFITENNVRRTNTREIGCGRPRTMFFDWLLKTEEDNISYDELKMLAQDRSWWCLWWRKPVIWAEYYSSCSIM